MQIPQTEITLRDGDTELLRVVLPPGEYVIGRDAEAEIRADTPLLSRRHAQLTINYDHLLIEDLGSANGTSVNGQPVIEATRLWPNQKVQLGKATLECRRIKTVVPLDVSLAPATAALREVLPEEFLHGKKYDIGSVIAQGGMGAILDVREAATERQVAMKVMLDGSSPDDLVRFVAEAKVTAQLEHPNIVPVHELSIDENGQPFYTMKMVRGITLRKVLELMATGAEATVRKYPLGTLLTIFQKVCDAVAFAHSKGVIHRDLKPENIMLGDFGEVLVMDWGLAKVLGGTDSPPPPGTIGGTLRRSRPMGSATMTGSIMGTPQYMAPEQARGEVETLDARADIYSLGAILYHLLALRPSVEGADAMTVVERVATGRTDPLDRAQKYAHLPGGRVPDSLAAVVRKAMALDPTQRYASVGDLQADLAAFQNGFATSAEKAGTWKHFTLLVKRHKAASIGVAAVLVLSIGFTAKVITEGRRAENALADLRKAEPTLLAQADASISLQKFDEALDHLDLATTISPRDPDLLRRRANLLQAMLRLDEAATGYQRLLAIRSDAAARGNLDLCQRLLAESRDPEKLSGPGLAALYAAMMGEKRVAEAVPLGVRIGKTNAQAGALMNERLKPWTALPGWGDLGRLAHMPDGSLQLTLSGLPISDLSPLTGLPINNLFLNGTKVSDLSPLREMPLRRLSVSGSAVSDLEPLRGMLLTLLQINGTKVEKFEVLATLPPTTLALRGLPLRDLSVLRGRKLVALNIGSTPVTSLEPLRGMPLQNLDAQSCQFTDLAPPAGMPLEYISLSDTKGVTSIEPLRNAPLQYASLANTGVTDFSPLNRETADLLQRLLHEH